MDARLIVVATLFAAMGLLTLVRPRSIGAIVDIRLDAADARNEVRAVYGGFGLAMAAVLVVAMRVPRLHDGIVACVALALAGMVVGRLVSAVIERPGARSWVFAGAETAGAALLAWSLA